MRKKRAKTAFLSGSEYKIVKSKLSHRATHRRGSRAIEKFMSFSFVFIHHCRTPRKQRNHTRARAQREKKRYKMCKKKFVKKKKKTRENNTKTHSKLPISDRFPSLHVLFQTYRAHDGCYYYRWCVFVLADE